MEQELLVCEVTAPSAPFRIPNLGAFSVVGCCRLSWLTLAITAELCWIFNTAAANPIAPLIAYEATARVPRGGEVQISLNAIPNYGNPVSFEITSPPRHGVLSAPRSSSDHSAVVTYHHDGSKASSGDVFFFRASTPGLARSAPYRVSVQIISPPAQLLLDPKLLDFGKVPLGETRRATFRITNIGGTKAVGRIVLPRGFSAPDGDSYELGENETTNMLVEFSPEEEKIFSSSASSLPGIEMTSLVLTGEGCARFRLLRHGDREWEITNVSAGQIPISLNYPGPAGSKVTIDGIESSRDTFIQSHSSKVLRIADEDHSKMQPGGTNARFVTVSDGLSTQSIQIPPSSHPDSIMLRYISPQFLGAFPAGSSIPVAFAIHNRSEHPKKVVWTALGPSGDALSSSPVDLQGGESREIIYHWDPHEPGKCMLKVVVKEDKSLRGEMDWSAILMTPVAKERGMIGSFQKSTQNESSASIDSSVETSSMEEGSAQIPIPGIVGLEWRVTKPLFEKPGLLIKWIPRKGSLPSPGLEEKMLVISNIASANEGVFSSAHLPSCKLVSIKVPFHKGNKDGDHETILVDGLDAGWHPLVLTEYSKDGEMAESQIQIQIPITPSMWVRWKIPLCLAALLLLLAVMLKVRRGF